MRYLILFLFSTSALAQSLSMPVDMPWSNITLVTTIVPLRSTTTGWAAISGKQQTINMSIAATSLAGQFPSQSTAWTVNAIRLSVCASGTYVCEQPMRIRQDKDASGQPISFLVPPGKALNFQLSSGVKQGTLTLSLDPIVSGGPITPPVDGVLVPPATQVTDATGSVWTLSGTRALKDGIDSGASGVVAILFKNGNIYIQQASGDWWRYDPGGPWFVPLTSAP